MPVRFCSFLAGVLLLDRSIDAILFNDYMTKFCIKYNDISDYGKDVDELVHFVYFKDGYIYLRYDYDFEFVHDGNVISLYDFLYNLTDSDIREFFNIPERENLTIYRPNVETNNKVKKKQNLLLRFKRTKVYM